MSDNESEKPDDYQKSPTSPAFLSPPPTTRSVSAPPLRTSAETDAYRFNLSELSPEQSVNTTTDGNSLVFSAKESRVLRHLEQQEHIQRSMENHEEDPERATKLKRENNRLLHIAMRRNRGASGNLSSPKKESPDTNHKRKISFVEQDIFSEQDSLSPVPPKSPLGRDRRAGSTTLSPRAKDGFGMDAAPSFSSTRRRRGHIPATFFISKQRARLLDIMKKKTIDNATVFDAIRRIRPLHPLGLFRRIWDWLLVVAVVYTLIVVPYEITFIIDEPVVGLIVVGVLLDVLFIVDILLTFRTSYAEVDGEYVTNFARIRRKYLRSWFIIDFIAAFPVNTILAILETQFNEHYFSAIKLIKVLRVFRLRHLFHALAGMKSSALLYLLILLCFFVIFAHWMGCLFWKIAQLEGFVGTWVDLQGSNPGVQFDPPYQQYTISLYWAFCTIATVGFGDIHPTTTVEQIYASLAILLGATLYAAIIGLISFVLREKFNSELHYEMKVASIQQFGKQNNLSPELQMGIRRYYKFIWERKKTFTTKSFVETLPLELRADIADAVNKKLIERNPVLRVCLTIGFQKLFAARLSQTVIKIKGEFLFFERDVITDVFFIHKGQVELISGLDQKSNEFVVSKLGDYQYCGDIGLFEENYKEDDSDLESVVTSPDKHHFVTACVVEMAEVNHIKVQDLRQLFQQYPREERLFREVAAVRKRRILQYLEHKFEEQASQHSTSVGEFSGGELPEPPKSLEQFRSMSGRRLEKAKTKLKTNFKFLSPIETPFLNHKIDPEADNELVIQTINSLTPIKKKDAIDFPMIGPDMTMTSSFLFTPQPRSSRLGSEEAVEMTEIENSEVSSERDAFPNDINGGAQLVATELKNLLVRMQKIEQQLDHEFDDD